MTILIDGYNFEGPYLNPQSLQTRSGVYAVLGANGNGNHSVIDIGESGDIQTRVLQHDREPCWRRQGKQLAYAALYLNERDRMRIEQELRAKFDPPCGKQ